MVSVGRAEVIEEYDYIIRSQRLVINMPAVVRLVSSFKRIKKEAAFTKNNIFARDKWTCQYCSKKLSQDELTFDHVLPRSRGGETRWENIVTACHPCNNRKGNRTPAEAHMALIKKPIKPDWFLLFSKIISKQEVPREWKYFFYL
jgi:5-methylcytosine-specific restriction endonuclease McrA